MEYNVLLQATREINQFVISQCRSTSASNGCVCRLRLLTRCQVSRGELLALGSQVRGYLRSDPRATGTGDTGISYIQLVDVLSNQITTKYNY